MAEMAGSPPPTIRTSARTRKSTRRASTPATSTRKSRASTPATSTRKSRASTPATSNLRKVTVFNKQLPPSSSTPASAHLPAPASAHLPAPASAHLPAPASAHLPAPASAHLPAPASAHLPAALASSSSHGLFVSSAGDTFRTATEANVAMQDPAVKIRIVSDLDAARVCAIVWEVSKFSAKQIIFLTTTSMSIVPQGPLTAAESAESKALKQEVILCKGKASNAALQAWLDHHRAIPPAIDVHERRRTALYVRIVERQLLRQSGAQQPPAPPPPVDYARKRAELNMRVAARRARVDELMNLRARAIENCANRWPRAPCHPDHPENRRVLQEKLLREAKKRDVARAELEAQVKARVDYLIELRTGGSSRRK
ncbi:hypothetical protein C8R46DRAFT_1045464 [Mycena filopes]|nr:hypothetical protein C8R46DRAFT_1045464 [Mycena filopes]